MKKLRLIAIVALTAVAMSLLAAPPGEGWNLVFSDEFNGTTADLDQNWEFQNGPSGHILCSRWRENAVVTNGVVRLLNKKEKRAGQDWTSASFWTKRQFQYGYFECRYRYGAATGLNNSFWIMTRGGTTNTPGRFEIDINEGHLPDKVNMNIHNWSGQHWSKSKSWRATGRDLSQEFHVYALEWTPTELIWFFDGQEIRRETNAICQKPAPVWLSSAIIKWAGPVTDAIDGTAMEVDYVRVYEKRGSIETSSTTSAATSARAVGAPINLALRAQVKASSTFDARYAAANAVDGVVSDDSRWLSRKDDAAPWVELDLGEPRLLRCAHVFSGWQDQDGLASFSLLTWQDGKWLPITGARVTSNKAQSVAVRFEKPVTAQRVRFVSTEPGPIRLRELALFADTAPLGAGVKLATAPAAASFPTNQHLIALNQVGFNTDLPKRFTAPLSPDGSKFEVRHPSSDRALFAGVIRNGIGDFSAFKPADSTEEYVVAVSGGGLKVGQSGRFSMRTNLWPEQFWQAAVDFMIDARSVVGTHPSAYGGCAWRDGTYYDFIVPSLVLLYLADPTRAQAMPVQMNWAKDKARVLAPDFKFDAKNPHPEGVMEAVRRYYTELEPPRDGAPDMVQLIHWGLGYYLFHPETRDPSGDPLPKKIHGQTVEQFAFLLWAWPQLKQWLPQSFYDRCREFAFANWEKSGLLEIDSLWDAKSYLTVESLTGPNPTGGFLHPYKGRHAPGHSIQPNLLMYEVARREGRADADKYLKAAQTQAQWIIDHLDWNDPRTTKGHRMSEFKTITGLVWFLQNYPDQAPAGLKQKITDWARVAIQRSENQWDFRRFDLGEHWTIPKLNEPGNLAGFTATALAASWVVDDAARKQRLRELAVAQMDNLFGRNPLMASSASHPEKGFPLVERGWPKVFQSNTCARIETTRGAICASPGSEMYPFNPAGAFRHSEGWVNFNAAWNMALAYSQWNRQSRAP